MTDAQEFSIDTAYKLLQGLDFRSALSKIKEEKTEERKNVLEDALIKITIENGVNSPVPLKKVTTTPLNLSIHAGLENLSAKLIENGANVNAQDSSGLLPLHFAAKYGSINTAKALLAKSARINSQSTETGGTALHVAAKEGNIEMVKLLVEKGASPVFENSYGETPITIAERKMESGSTEIKQQYQSILTLLKDAERKGANVIPSFYTEDEPVIRLLPESMSFTDAVKKIATLEDDSIRRRFEDELVEKLKRSGTINSKSEKWSKNCKTTPLHIATKYGLLSLCEKLTGSGADVNQKDDYGRTPLHIATVNANQNMVDLLLTNFADVAARTNSKHTATDLAYEKKNEANEDIYQPIIEKLEKAEEALEAKHCLELASSISFKKGVQMIAKGKIPEKNIEEFEDELVSNLMARGLLDKKSENWNNHAKTTALHISTKYGLTRLSEKLIQNGANVRAIDDLKNSPLHLAVINGDQKSVELFLGKQYQYNVSEDVIKLAEAKASEGDYKQKSRQKIVQILNRNKDFYKKMEEEDKKHYSSQTSEQIFKALNKPSEAKIASTLHLPSKPKKEQLGL